MFSDSNPVGARSLGMLLAFYFTFQFIAVFKNVTQTRNGLRKCPFRLSDSYASIAAAYGEFASFSAVLYDLSRGGSGCITEDQCFSPCRAPLCPADWSRVCDSG